MRKELTSVIILKPYQCSSAGKLSFVGEPDGYHTAKFDLKGPISLKLSMVSKIVQHLHMRSNKLRSSCRLFSCSCQDAGHERQFFFIFCKVFPSHFSFLFAMTPLLKGLLPSPPSNDCSSSGILGLSRMTAIFSRVHAPRPAGTICPLLTGPSGVSFSPSWLLCSVCGTGNYKEA